MGADPTIDLVSTGEEALVTGDWDGAREAYASAVDADPTPQALDGLGRTLWWLGDVDGAIEHREGAYAAFRKRGDLATAAGSRCGSRASTWRRWATSRPATAGSRGPRGCSETPSPARRTAGST